MDLGMKFEIEYEDGDYEIHRSTNHTDLDRQAVIIVDHALCENAPYAGIIENDMFEEVDRKFFQTWQDAQRWLESEVTHTVYVGPLSEGMGDSAR